MALPSKLKTWQFATNLDPGFNGSDLNDSSALFVLVKDAMQAFPLNPWTCEGSSDSATAGMDAVDRLTDYTKVVHSGGNHSWIVLGQDASGTNWQVLFDFADGDYRDIYIYISPTGVFTGGAINSRPTAVDEIAIVFNPRYFISGTLNTGGNGFSCRAHVMQSSDGLCTRIVTCRENIARFFLFIEKPIDPPTGWTNPVVMGCYGDDTAPPNDPMSIARWCTTADIWRAVGPVTTMHMNATMKGFATNGTANGVFVGATPWTGPDESSGQFPLNGVGIAHMTTVGQRGRHGYLADLYHTGQSVLQGNSFPGDGTKSFVVFGNMALPWDGGDVEMG